MFTSKIYNVIYCKTLEKQTNEAIRISKELFLYTNAQLKWQIFTVHKREHLQSVFDDKCTLGKGIKVLWTICNNELVSLVLIYNSKYRFRIKNY